MANRRLVDEYLPWIECRLVLRARRDGVTWTGIGRLLGRSRQAVQQRHDRVWTAADLLPPGTAPHRHPPAEESRQASIDRRREQDSDDAAAADSLVPW